MKLYDYWRSSASYRVRIGLKLKEIEVETIPVSLIDGDQLKKEYLSINPQGLVPSLDVGPTTLIQSLAILEWLDENYPVNPLLPKSSIDRAKVRAQAQIISVDIHPLNNLRVTNHLKSKFNATSNQIEDWVRQWITQGFGALESKVGVGPLLWDSLPRLGDVCLVPQMHNARRYNIDLSSFPKLLEIEQKLNQIPAFFNSQPESDAYSD